MNLVKKIFGNKEEKIEVKVGNMSFDKEVPNSNKSPKYVVDTEVQKYMDKLKVPGTNELEVKYKGYETKIILK